MLSQKARKRYTRMGEPSVTNDRYMKYSRTVDVDRPIKRPKKVQTPNAERSIKFCSLFIANVL